MKTKIDIDGLKQTADLPLIVKYYLGAPVKMTGHGTWWRCPFHQEKSASFLVGGRPDRAQEYHCFGCGQHGDVIQFVRYMEHLPEDGKGFIAAIKRVAEIAGMPLFEFEKGHEREISKSKKPVGPPAEKWQDCAREFCAQAQEALWQPIGAGCLRYLREVRGLKDEAIREFGLGWNVGTSKSSQEKWGIPEREKPIWLPQGLVIPGEVDGMMWYVKIRPSKNVRCQMKYYQLPSPTESEHTALLGADRWQSQLPVLLCEGEIDMITAWQEGRELMNMTTLGGAAKGRIGEKLNFGRWLWRLITSERIFVAYDADAAGETAAAALNRISARFEGVMVPWGKDINEYHVSGGSVNQWLIRLLGGRDGAG